ncbi:MAG: thiol peroxidase [Candidatus Omnitrophota bacterium]
MPSKITFNGSPLTLVGRRIDAGSMAPDFRVISQGLKEAGLSDFRGKVKLISSFPSLDTPVCDLQVKEFNKKAAGLSIDIVVLGISKDLPFAQSRFCSLNEIRNESVLSDYKYSSFGLNYGLLIKELNLLARAVLIVDKNDILRYFKIAPELTKAVDYEDALANLEVVLKSPPLTVKQESIGHCKPCAGAVLALPPGRPKELLVGLAGWILEGEKKISKEFGFRDFSEAKYFLDLLSVIAEEQGHHPEMALVYNKLKVTLTTHAAGGLTENDFIMARIIDSMGI